jgi:hypothetical protein
MASQIYALMPQQEPPDKEPTPDDLARIEKALAKREKKALRRARLLLSAKPWI